MMYVTSEPCVDVSDRACVEECPGAAKLGVVGADAPLVAGLPLPR